MLAKNFDPLVRARSLQDRPLGSSFVSFAQELSDAGYAQVTAYIHTRAAEHLIYWVGREGVPIQSLDEPCVERFYRHLSHCHCPDYNHSGKSRVLRGALMFLSHLRKTGQVNQAVAEVVDPILLVAFRRWMHVERGTCETTLESYSRPIRDLLTRLGEDPGRFDAQSLRQFVVERSQRPGGGDVQRCVGALRAFCCFLSAEGLCSRDLSAAVPTVARWRLSCLPRYLRPEEVERVIAACDLESPVGRRDRAILLLLARLGLRANDVAQLRLDDINWEEGWFAVCGKSRRPTQLPLSQEVGDALARYLQEDRPQTDATAVFVRARAPFVALGSHCAVSLIVARALRRAKVIRPGRGAAHLLRHGLATSLLRQGASLQEIADILRHRSVTTTQIYAKVDVVALQQMARPWPGAPSC